jgi:hypothetical protein
VAEQPVFWLGGKPGANKQSERQVPEAEHYEPAIREACEGCGFELDEYVAAQGGYGGWLAHLEREGKRYRVFWSGKDKNLRFEQAQLQGGWNELASSESIEGTLPAFVESLSKLLADNQGD